MTLDQATDKVYDALIKLGPQITDTALTAARVSAINDLLCIPGFAIAGYLAYRLGNLFFSIWDKKSDEFADGFAAPMVGAVFYGFSILFGFIALCNLFTVWGYVGLFRPDVYLAHQLIK